MDLEKIDFDGQVIMDDNLQVGIVNDTVICQIFDRVSQSRVQGTTIWQKQIENYKVLELRPMQVGFFTD